MSTSHGVSPSRNDAPAPAPAAVEPPPLADRYGNWLLPFDQPRQVRGAEGPARRLVLLQPSGARARSAGEGQGTSAVDIERWAFDLAAADPLDREEMAAALVSALAPIVAAPAAPAPVRRMAADALLFAVVPLVPSALALVVGALGADGADTGLAVPMAMPLSLLAFAQDIVPVLATMYPEDAASVWVEANALCRAPLAAVAPVNYGTLAEISAAAAPGWLAEANAFVGQRCLLQVADALDDDFHDQDIVVKVTDLYTDRLAEAAVNALGRALVGTDGDARRAAGAALEEAARQASPAVGRALVAFWRQVRGPADAERLARLRQLVELKPSQSMGTHAAAVAALEALADSSANPAVRAGATKLVQEALTAHPVLRLVRAQEGALGGLPVPPAVQDPGQLGLVLRSLEQLRVPATDEAAQLAFAELEALGRTADARVAAGCLMLARKLEAVDALDGLRQASAVLPPRERAEVLAALLLRPTGALKQRLGATSCRPPERLHLEALRDLEEAVAEAEDGAGLLARSAAALAAVTQAYANRRGPLPWVEEIRERMAGLMKAAAAAPA